jgi:uracil phosphoribosyltransferase
VFFSLLFVSFTEVSSKMTPSGQLFLDNNRAKFPNLHVVQQTTQLRGIHTVIRDKNCEVCPRSNSKIKKKKKKKKKIQKKFSSFQRSDFVFQSDRLIRMVVEEALSLLPTTPHSVTTPTGV